jgi:hypothetical protein
MLHSQTAYLQQKTDANLAQKTSMVYTSMKNIFLPSKNFHVWQKIS